ncbi:unnamed protein product [Brachionus calyciflorus]|uniref:Uncharacterized protein n=1 Tax=Brachionus calyciflorus TaxID=104777 RepID=A0A814QH02_9BILA|nr:unnamed protein product [Brachionus calyciflorus]
MKLRFVLLFFLVLIFKSVCASQRLQCPPGCVPAKSFSGRLINSVKRDNVLKFNRRFQCTPGCVPEKIFFAKEFIGDK